MSKKITSAQINDATQTRFVPGSEKKPDMLTRQEASKELKKRGFEHLIKKEKLWVKNFWPELYKKLN